MRKNSIGLLALLACAGTALAAPQENTTFLAVPSVGPSGGIQNAVLTHTFTGGYPVGGIQISGSLTEVNTGTFASEARILVTPPVGSPFIAQASTLGGFTGTTVIASLVLPTNSGVTDAAGTWTFRFYESFDDSADLLVDATWDTITITLDDQAEPVVSTPAPVAGVFTEVEPNDTPYVGNRVIGLADGNSITGTTTGASTTVAGAASSDNFLITTAPQPLGIYRNRLAITSTPAGHTGSIRGLIQASQGAALPGAIALVSDNVFQTSSSTTTPARFNQWYGFGRSEQLYYRVTGAAATTAPYTSTFSSTPVTTIPVATTLDTGAVTISRIATNTTAVDMALYDGNLNPVAGALNQGNNTLTRTLTPGTYYLFVSNINTADNQASPADDTSKTGAVLDNPNIIGNTSTTLVANVGMRFVGGSATVDVAGAKAGVYDVLAYRFTVATPVGPTNPSLAVSATPGTVNNGGASTTQLLATVTPGLNPTSTGITVNADLTNLGGAAAVAMFDDGLNGDGAAGDNVFGLLYTVPNTVVVGPQTITFTAADAQSRSNTNTATVTVILPPPANDTCGTAITVAAGAPAATGDNALATTGPGENPLCATGSKGVWYDFTAGPAGTYRFSTEGSIQSDTVLALYDACGGTQIACDDDSGTTPAASSLLDIALTAGQNVKVMVASFGSGAAGGGYTLNIIAPVTTSPTGVGSATPATVVNDGTGTTNLRVTVTPGQVPTSTNHIVTVDAAAIGAGSVVLLDDGIAPDAVAGDLIFNGTATVATGTTVGALSLPFGITCSDTRTGSGTIALTVREPRGACCVGGVATVQDASACATAGGTFLGDGSSPLGAGTVYASTDSFPIAIPDFVGTTPGTASSTITITDTTNISSLTAKVGLTHTFVGDLIGTLSNGTTTVTLFSRVGGTTELAGTYNIADLASTPFGTGASPLATGDYAPAGTGAGPLSAFAGSAIAGTWTLTITDNAGADIGSIDSFSIVLNPTPCAVACLADIAGGETGGPDGVVDGSDYVAFINSFSTGDVAVDPKADVAGGDNGGPDGIIDGTDYIAFINAFAAGC